MCLKLNEIVIVIGCSNGNQSLYTAFDKGIDLLYPDGDKPEECNKKPINSKRRPILFSVDESGVLNSTWFRWGGDQRSREVVQKFHDLDASKTVKTIYVIENYASSDAITAPASLLAWYAMFPDLVKIVLRKKLATVVAEIISNDQYAGHTETSEMIFASKIKTEFENLMRDLRHG